MAAPRVHTIEGIVLKRKNYGEGDRIITLFTKEYGKIRVVGRGVRKITSRRASHLEVFARVTAVIHTGKSMDSITEVSSLSHYEGIRTNLTKVSVAYYLTELIDSLLAEKQEHRDVYVLYMAALEALAEAEERSIYRVSTEFTVTLLRMLGFLSEDRNLKGSDLPPFIESITERKMKSSEFARLLVPKAKS